MKKSNYKKNTRIYIIDYILSFFFIPVAVWTLIWEKHVDYPTIGLILSAGMITQTLLELPSGALADIIGRKKTVILSRLFYVLAFIFIVPAQHWKFFFLSELTYKLSETLQSGAKEALIYDSLKENGKESKFQDIESKAYFLATIGFIIASILGGFLYEIGERIPYIALVIVGLIGFIVSLFFEEPQIETRDKLSVKVYLKQNWYGFMHIFRNRKITLISAYSSALNFVFLSGLWILYQKAANEFGFPARFVGILIGTMYFSRAIGTAFFQCLPEKNKSGNFIKIVPVIQGVSSLMLILPVPLAIFGLAARYFVDGINRPFLSKMQNDEIESKFRATSLSAIALLTSILLAFAQPFIGIGIANVGARGIISIIGFVSLLIAFPLSFFLENKIKNNSL